MLIKVIVLLFFSLVGLNKGLALQASINHYVQFENGSPVSELHFYILGNSVDFVKDSENVDLTSSQVLVTIFYKQGDILANFEKYILKSDLTSTIINFTDVKRFSIKPGDYDLEIILSDVNDDSNVLVFKKKISIPKFGEDVIISDIKMYSPKGEDLPFHLYSESANNLLVSAEVFNTINISKDAYFIKYSIRSKYTGEVGSDETIKKHKRYDSNKMEKVLIDFDISNLKSGNYHFLIEVFSKDKILLASKSVNFIRSNPKMEAENFKLSMADLKYTFVYDLPSDSLNYFLKAHLPIVNSNVLPALNYIIKDSLEAPKRAFIFQYWNEVYKDRAESNFEKYIEVAKSVDKEYYNTVGYGFQTDRGYIFLKYGRPNNILPVEDDPAAPPYEIWFYNYLEYTGQSNVKFLFYCPTKVNNHYDLLHSNCRNERNNPQWEIELYKNSPNEIIGNSIDATGVQDNWGRMAKRYFNQF